MLEDTTTIGGNGERVTNQPETELTKSLELLFNGRQIRVSVDEPKKTKTRADRLIAFAKDASPIATAIAGVVISIFVARINTRQAESTDASLRAAAIRELSADSAASAKTELAAIAFANFGREALPATKMFLSSTQPDVRKRGVILTEKIFLAEEIPRADLLAALSRYFDSPAPALQEGVAEVYKALGPHLTEPEFNTISTKLRDYAASPQPAREPLVSIASFLEVVPQPTAPLLMLAIVDKLGIDDDKKQVFEFMQKSFQLLSQKNIKPEGCTQLVAGLQRYARLRTAIDAMATLHDAGCK